VLMRHDLLEPFQAHHRLEFCTSLTSRLTVHAAHRGLKQDVRFGAAPLQQLSLLEDVADVLSWTRDAITLDLDLSARSPRETGHHLQERRFSAPRWSRYRDEFARQHPHVDVFECGDRLAFRPEGHGDIFDIDRDLGPRVYRL